MLWNDDLDEFMEKLQEVEEKEIADAAEGETGKAKKGKKKTFKQETMASPNGNFFWKIISRGVGDAMASQEFGRSVNSIYSGGQIMTT